jgi:hypothetical protein
VVAAEHALAVGEDRVLVLDDAVRRQPPSFSDRFIEPRVSVMRMPTAAASLRLDVHRPFEPNRKEVVVVGSACAAGHEARSAPASPRRNASASFFAQIG